VSLAARLVDLSDPVKLSRRIARWARRRAAATSRRLPRRQGLAALRAEDDPRARLLADALDATARMSMSDQERSWIDRIEGLRGKLEGSSERMEHRFSEWTGDDAHGETLLVNTVAEVTHRKSQPPMSGFMLFKLVRAFRPGNCLELGTGVGISAAFQGAALALNGDGRLVTLEALASRVALAREVLADLGLASVEVRGGRFQALLGDVLDELGVVDFAFVDGHHDEAATIRYFERILPFLAKDGVLVFDDIRWSDGMRRAWSAISTDRRLKLAVDLGRAGVCLRGSPGDPPSVHSVPL
jgi:predicted O-methyltransferase YrrM